MRYITVEERKRYEKLAEEYNVAGYTNPSNLMCCRSEYAFKKSNKKFVPPKKEVEGFKHNFES